jgi:hypothetical protein
MAVAMKGIFYYYIDRFHAELIPAARAAGTVLPAGQGSVPQIPFNCAK